MTTTKPLASYGQWDVYDTHIVNARAGYELDRSQLLSYTQNWAVHMSGKQWCHLPDFMAAYALFLMLESERANQQFARLRGVQVLQ
jgi:hypothetical protein